MRLYVNISNLFSIYVLKKEIMHKNTSDLPHETFIDYRSSNAKGSLAQKILCKLKRRKKISGNVIGHAQNIFFFFSYCAIKL